MIKRHIKGCRRVEKHLPGHVFVSTTEQLRGTRSCDREEIQLTQDSGVKHIASSKKSILAMIGKTKFANSAGFIHFKRAYSSINVYMALSTYNGPCKIIK